MLAQGAELGGALLAEGFIVSCLTQRLVHIVDLQGKDGEAVNRPSGALGVDLRLSKGCDAGEVGEEEAVDELN